MPEPTDEETIFATIEATYRLAPEAELQAMVQELRHRLPTIPLDRRTPLIEAIERSIGENLEWPGPDF